MCVNNLLRVALDSVVAEIWTRMTMEKLSSWTEAEIVCVCVLLSVCGNLL